MFRTDEWARLMRRLGTVGCWPLDERSGTTAYDWSGYNRNGTWNGSPALWSRRTYDGRLCSDFDGSNDYASVGDANDFSIPATGWTAMCWGLLDSLAGANQFPSFVVKRTTTVEWGLVGSNNFHSNNAGVEVNNSGGSTVARVDSSGNLGTNKWYFVVGTYDDSAKVARIYFNGKINATGSTGSGSVFNGTGSVWLGAGNQTSSDGLLNGALERVALFPYVMESSKIMALYRAQGGRIGAVV